MSRFKRTQSVARRVRAMEVAAQEQAKQVSPSPSVEFDVLSAAFEEHLRRVEDEIVVLRAVRDELLKGDKEVGS